MKQCFNSFSRVFTNFCCLYFQAHPVSLPGYSEEVFHASLPAVSRCLLLLPFLSKAFSLFPKLLHSMTDLLPPVTMQAQTLKNPSVCAWRGSWNGCIPNVVTGKEKLHQGFFIRLGPDELRGRSVWWIQENLPRLLVFPEVRHTMSLEERKYRRSKILLNVLQLVTVDLTPLCWCAEARFQWCGASGSESELSLDPNQGSCHSSHSPAKYTDPQADGFKQRRVY